MITALPSLRAALKTMQAVVKDKLHLLKVLEPSTYTKKCPLLHATVGQHIRHSLHHVNESLKPLMESRNKGVLDYDNRARGDEIETNIEHAKHTVAKLSELITRLLDDTQLEDSATKLVVVAFHMSEEEGESVLFDSTVAREVAFSSHHAMHHLAQMKISVEAGGGVVDGALCQTFGMARSTKFALGLLAKGS